MTEKQHLELLAALEANSISSDRTTHAVRAFVRFLFIQLTALTLAGFLYGMSASNVNALQCATSGQNCSPNGFLVVLAFLVAVIGIIWSSNAGWSELAKSVVTNSSEYQLSAVEHGSDVSQDEVSQAKVAGLLKWEKQEWEKAGSPSLATWNQDELSLTDWLASR